MSSRPSSQPSPAQGQSPENYYTLLGLNPWVSERQIRNRYRELSKLYHPDTTSLPPDQAVEKFQQLNQAYATLSNVERRLLYDRSIGFSRVYVAQPANANPAQNTKLSSSAYLEPTDRPLSPGEIFALFILALTFVACLVLVIVIGVVRGDAALQPLSAVVPVTEPVQESPEKNVRLENDGLTSTPAQVAPDLPDLTHVPAVP